MTRRDKIKNDKIRKSLAVESVLCIIEKNQLRWYGHVLRMPDTRDTKRMYNWKAKRKRPIGRPRKRWEDQIKEITQREEKNFEKVKSIALDRTEWKVLIKRLSTDRHRPTGVRVS
ncbi:uncharacterized protein LOC117120222, partial [Anneissia japonica]|uniref:uncharacterized protein LOC117120222 n=1 Tax=Anneissia japonica TaxID=1529436 RepID=UPI0014255E18